ncbi:LacI family transcriptional regulator [Luteimicrobium album]|uniref:LacI family transcriptional regulator n=1 Tax=Luteimicrobium album TaxID=1054550 RepID=A0ABQ6HZK1_9MICO|nr:LacI family DNA-binding transcriptional regulator [Luteimicrobium album]GMA23328.1 LacI family transcriptional regulator [Luteimicrobium album]
MTDPESTSARFGRPVRLSDVAAQAGVSVKTVSRVLNGEQYVTETMRQLVLRTAAELGYVGDSRARTLRTNRSGFLGFVVPDIRNGFFARLTQSMETRVANAGQTMLLGISDELPEKEDRYLRLFRQQRIDGLVVVPAGGPSLIDVSHRLPVVVLERTTEELQGKADHVLVQNFEAAQQLTRHLAGAHGLTELAMVGGESTVSSVMERRRGFVEAVTELGLPLHESNGHLSIEDATAGALALFRTLEPPFGVFATGSRMYWGVMAAIAQLGLRIPKDVAVVTFDGTGDVNISPVMPTQAILPVETMTARAMQLLVERTASPELEPRTRYVECDIIYGTTCGCVESDLTGPLVVRGRA